MNGFRRLIVENFQSHQKSVVEFAPAGQLTIIIGRSRSGKTALIRALRWLLYNSPRGVSVPDKAEAAGIADGEKSGYCRVGAAFIRVTLEMDSGHVVIRERTRSKNQYKIIALDAKEPQVFEGFGDSVPLEVQVITGVRPIRIGDTEVNLNLSEQLDGPFMGTKSMSAPARAKVLGKLAGTEEIDYAGQKLAADLRRREQDEKRLAAELVETEAKIEEYQWLPEFEQRIVQAEQLTDSVRISEQRRSMLAKLQAYLAQSQRQIDEAQEVINSHLFIDAAEAAVSLATDSLMRRGKVVQLSGQYARANDEMQRCEQVLDRLQCLELAELELTRAEVAAERRNKLMPLRRAWLAAEMMLGQVYSVLKRTEGVGAAEVVVAGIEDAYKRRERLFAIRHNFNGADYQVKGAQLVLRRTERLAEAEAATASVLSAVSRKADIGRLHGNYESADAMVQKSREQIVVWENRVAELEGAYRDELVNLGKCPTCGSIVNPEKLKEVC